MNRRKTSSFWSPRSKRQDDLKVNVVHQFEKGLRKRTNAGAAIQIKSLESRIGDWTYDQRFFRRNLLIFINAMIGLILALIELEIAWIYSTEELTESGSMRRRLGEPFLSKLIKFTISILTIILMLQIIGIYQLQNHVKREIWGGFYHSWDMKIWSKLMLELLVVSFHPLPFGDRQVHQSAACLMFLRFYLFTRVFRDYSNVYRSRKHVTMKLFGDVPNPKFDWVFSLRVAFSRRPIPFILTFAALAVGSYSVIIYELEREIQPEKFNIRNAFWYTFTTVTTLGFGDYIVITTRGRFMTGFIVATGMLLDTLVVVAILENISLGQKGRVVLNFLEEQEARSRMEAAAVAYIVHWWRWKVKKCSEKRTASGNKRSRLSSIIPINTTNTSDVPIELVVAMESLHHERQRWKLLDRLSEDPVLQSIHSVDRNIAELWHHMNPRQTYKTIDEFEILSREIRRLRENQDNLIKEQAESKAQFAAQLNRIEQHLLGQN